LKGNPGKRPINKAEPKPPVGDVRAPRWLSPKGGWAWRRIAPVLREMGLLTTADPHALALLCEAYAEYVEAREVVNRDGSTYESTRLCGKGEDTFVVTMVRARPEVAIASDAWKRVRTMMQEFGMTPSSRSRISSSEKDDRDEFDRFLSGEED
ncbi:hypothetical protein LCGC14_1278650, partial [marine sediment metagenome]